MFNISSVCVSMEIRFSRLRRSLIGCQATKAGREKTCGTQEILKVSYVRRESMNVFNFLGESPPKLLDSEVLEYVSNMSVY